MYIGHDENRTANQIYLLDKKVELSVLISWLFCRRLCLCLETANAECLPGKIFPRLRWLFRFTRFIETK